MAAHHDHEPDLDRGVTIAARFVSYLIYWYLVVVELILATGFVLLLFGANPDSEFVRWTYRSLDRAMGPFRGIFEPLEIGSNEAMAVPAVFDTTILFAMMAYGIVLVALGSFIHWLTRRVRAIDVQHELDAQYSAYRQSVAAGAPPDLATLADNASTPPIPGIDAASGSDGNA